MRRMLAVLGLFATMSLSATSPAEAGEIPPTVQFDKAWTVAGGSAVEVAYVIACPDPSDQEPTDRHALATNYGYLEFRCSAQPQRVVMLLEGAPPAKGASLTLNATVYTPQCLYWDSSGLANGEQGCWKVSRTDTARPRPGSFVRESSVDIGARVDVTAVSRTGDGGVRLTAVFSCIGSGIDGDVVFEVRQMTRAGFTAVSVYVGAVPCHDESFTRSFALEPSSVARPFRKGEAVVRAEWVQSYEGGPWAWDTGLHRLR
jgi:hypothetical protein